MPRKNKFKKPKGPKDKTEQIHAKRRFSQRFDKELTDKEYNILINNIQSNKAEFIDRQSNRLTRWKVSINDIEAIAVYDKQRKTIVTFLTVDMIENYNMDEITI